MQKTLYFGEAVVFWVPRGIEKIGALQIPLYAKFSGSSPANIGVACQKLAIDSTIIVQIGYDATRCYQKRLFRVASCQATIPNSLGSFDSVGLSTPCATRWSFL